jgi:mannose-6-phosphate isomerase
MTELYPLKFAPQYKSKIWGGNKFRNKLGKADAPDNTCGESWEISGIEGNCSVVSGGFLQGSTLQEIIDMYMDDLLGEKVIERFGSEFPLLFKFLDINDLLSIQVHPPDEVALQRHDSLGKTEMWYVVDAEPGSELIIGFNKTINRDTFIEHVVAGRLPELLNKTVAHKDEVYFIPASRIHSSGKGLLIAEIQQSSDVTYRVSDWDRREPDGTARELHVDLSLDVLDYTAHPDYQTHYTPCINTAVRLVTCNYFTVNLIEFDSMVNRDYSSTDSFVAYMCLEGHFTLKTPSSETTVASGETILVPSCIDSVQLVPARKSKIMEVYM